MYNARRAERAARHAAELLGRRLPPMYPDRYADEVFHARSPADVALMQRHTEGALVLLDQALELERRAEEATRAAIEALRWGAVLGIAPSWADLGKRLGLSPAGAHKRYRDVEGPGPELTIDDEPEHAPAA